MNLPLSDASFSPGVHAADWRAAVRAAGVDLVHAGAAGRAYVDAMVRQIEEAGPFCVVTPGVAVPHSKAGADVRRSALAIVVLDEPVAFGHPHHDPVRVVIALAAPDPREHLRMLSALANVLDKPGVTDRLAAAGSHAEAVAVLGG